MSSKHTPGPWHTDAAGHVYSEDAFFGKCTIAKCEIAPFPGKPGRMGVLRPNADLIAAAPDLYSICERLGNVGLIDGDGNLHGELQAVLNDAAELIRKLDLAKPRAIPAAILDGSAA